MATLDDNGCYTTYLSLIPRGFHHSVRENIIVRLSTDHDYHVSINFVGEASPESDHISDTTKLIQDQLQAGKKKKKINEEIKSSCFLEAMGSAELCSVGYYTNNAKQKQSVWSCPGELQGAIWMKIVTNAPIEIIANQLRILGPILALVNVYDDNDEKNNNKDNSSVLPTNQSLDEAVKTVKELIKSKDYPFKTALKLWQKHINSSSWGLSQQELETINRKIEGKEALKYRLSCLRSSSYLSSDDTKNNLCQYKYTRQQFLSCMADVVVPHDQFPAEIEAWQVDLTKYDLDVVLLVRENALAVGLSLKPYRQLGAKTWSQGVIPMDVNPPYLSGEVRSSVIRLRPATAHMLLDLAQLEPGDVVLDPCSGVGTIPMEVMFHRTSAVSIGGDIVLTSTGLGPIAASYSKQVHAINDGQRMSKSNVADQLAWDATNLSLRDSTVDAVVTDLPFGKQCLSRSKLEGILPLMVSEIARVLRPNTGRMILLCGNYQVVLKSLQTLNGENKTKDSDPLVINMPCDSILPVNIGGLQAWVVIAKRGPAKAIKAVSKHKDRVRTLTRKRERTEACQKNVKPNKKQWIQS